MYELENKIYFYALFIIPILLVCYLGLYFWKRRSRRLFASEYMLSKLAPGYSSVKPVLKLALIVFFFSVLIIALVNPKLGVNLKTVKRAGVDVVFAVDVSKSMAAEDIAPSRIDKAKRLVSESIKTLVGDRIGIITYAARAYPQLPITTDYSSANMFLKAINTDMMSSQGTAISEAINLASTFYDDDSRTNRILFIISDGEDHSGKSLNSIKNAVKKGIRVFTVGVGTAKGSPIFIQEKNGNRSYKKDKNGEVVITKLNEKTLQKIAQEGGGKYINGYNTKEVKKLITNVLKSTKKSEYKSKQFSDYKSQFQWFLGGALLFLILDTLLLNRKTLWIMGLNIFNETSRKK